MTEVDKLIDEVCDYFGTSKDLVLSQKRKGGLVKIRFWIIYFIHHYYPEMTPVDIGLILDRERTTILHAIKQCWNKVDYGTLSDKEEHRQLKRLLDNQIKGQNVISLNIRHVTDGDLSTIKGITEVTSFIDPTVNKQIQAEISARLSQLKK